MSPCADSVRELWRRIRLEFIVEVSERLYADHSQKKQALCESYDCNHSPPYGCPCNKWRTATNGCHLFTSTLLMQLPLLRDRWKLILFGACFQYVHGIATQLAHRMHQPMNQPLHDIGLSFLPVSLHEQRIP